MKTPASLGEVVGGIVTSTNMNIGAVTSMNVNTRVRTEPLILECS
jgi:hypothetical protein